MENSKERGFNMKYVDRIALVLTIVGAVGNHEEQSGFISSAVSAA